MNTILVPTDYAEVSLNAANYAIKLAASLQIEKIVLYNAYQTPTVLTETAVPVMPIMNVDAIKAISEQAMARFKEKLAINNDSNISIEHKTAFSILSEDINSICEDVAADLIVMGITASSKIEEVLVGSTALSVIKQTKIPVIIVPAEAKFTGIKNVMLACDYKRVIETIPVEPIKRILNDGHANLHIVHVQENRVDDGGDKTAQQQQLASLFKEYNPGFTFENNEDFIAEINHFVEANNIDLIITIPRKHKMFEGLFKERHTKKLAFHSHVPLMYLHLNDV